MQIARERRSSKAHGLTGAMAVLGALAWSTAAMAWTGQPLAYGAGATGGPSVPVLDTGNNTVVATLPCCQFSAISPDAKYLYSFSFLSVGVIDTASGNVIATIPIPPSREAYAFGAIAVSPDGKSIYVTVEHCLALSFSCSTPSAPGYTRWIIDTLTSKVSSDGEHPGSSNGLAFSPDGRYAYWTLNNSYFASPPLASVIIDELEGSSERIQVALPLSTAGAIAVAPDGKHIYITGTDFINNFISVVDTTAKTVTAIISLGTSPTGMVVTPNGKKIYVADGNSVSVIDSGNNKVVATLPVAGNGIAVTPDGTRVYVGNSVIDTVTDQVVATLPVSASWFIIPPPQGTPFLAFNTKLAIEFGNGGLQQDSFDLRTSFVLSSTASNGIHPDTEPVKLQVGPFTTVIPAESFKKQGANYAYEGTINGVKLGAKIVPTGTLRYNFYITAKDLNLMGIPHLAQVSLSIGDDAGLATVTPRVKRHGVIRDTASQGLSGI